MTTSPIPSSTLSSQKYNKSATPQATPQPSSSPCFLEYPATNPHTTTLSSTMFALCMTGVPPYDQDLGILNGVPAILWVANRGTPARGTNISLSLQDDGDLVLRGYDDNAVGIAAWRSNTSGRAVSRMVLSGEEMPATLILYDLLGGIVWQSMDYPVDTLSFGQSLWEGMKLVSRVSAENMSEGEYSLVVHPSHQLSLLYEKEGSDDSIPYWIWSSDFDTYANQSSCGNGILTCSGPIHYLFSIFITSEGLSAGYPYNYSVARGLSYPIPNENLQTTFLRLEWDGSLRLYYNKEKLFSFVNLFSDENGCLLPESCGSYGVCVGKKQCKCPDAGGVSTASSPHVPSFIPLDLVNPEKGCKLAQPLLICGNDATIASDTHSNTSQVDVQMQVLEGVDYFSYIRYSLPVLNVSHDMQQGHDCSNLCFQNCTCLAAFWHVDLNACFHVSYQQMGSFRGGLNVTTYKAYLKLPTRFSYEELHGATNGFSHKLGKGGFGAVYAGVIPTDGMTRVAVKKLEGMRQGEKEFKTELAIMAGIHHYNLLQLIGYCVEGADWRLLVYKYMENGSLDQWLFASPGATLKNSSGEEHSVKGKEAKRLQWGLRYSIAVGVTKGLAYLHEECQTHILHLDVKPQNILLDENFVAKVADFGLARGMEREESHMVTTMRGTPGYLAPEWIKEGTIDVKCDVFSFGMLLMEIVSGRKNSDARQTTAPYYPEWAYSQIVTNKLTIASDNLNGSKSVLTYMNENLVTGSTPLFSATNKLTSPDPLHSKCTIDVLTDSKIESENEQGQLWRLITMAFLCMLEKPEWRPPMGKVVQMLEGLIPLSHIDLSSLYQGLTFVLGSHDFSRSHGYDTSAEKNRHEFQKQLYNVLALSSTSSAASCSGVSQLSGR